MPEERTCVYTGKTIEPGTGIMYIKANGEVLHFVDSKAEKNYLLGREPRDLEWTEAGGAGEADARVATVEEETGDNESTVSEAADSDDDDDPADPSSVDEEDVDGTVSNDEGGESQDGDQ